MKFNDRFKKLEAKFSPPKELPIIIVRDESEITDIDSAIWILIKF